MSEHGVPESIAHTYANPSQGWQAVQDAIPAGEKVTAEMQAAATAKENADTSLASQQSAASLGQQAQTTAALAEARQKSMTDAQVAGMNFSLKLDNALYQGKIDQYDAQTRGLQLANDAKSLQNTQDTANQDAVAKASQLFNSARPDGLRTGEYDNAYNSILLSAKGMPAQAAIQGMYTQAQTQAAGMTYTALQQKWDPDIQKAYLGTPQEWAAKTAPQIRNDVEMGNQRQAELAARQNLDKFNVSAMNLGATSLVLNPENYRAKAPDGSPANDARGYPLYNTVHMANEMAQNQSTLDLQSARLANAAGTVEEVAQKKVKDNDVDKVNLTKQIDKNTDASAKLANARVAPIQSGQDELIRSLIPSMGSAPDNPVEKMDVVTRLAWEKAHPDDPTGTKAMNKQRTEQYDLAAKTLKDRELELQNEQHRLSTLDPRKEFSTAVRAMNPKAVAATVAAQLSADPQMNRLRATLPPEAFNAILNTKAKELHAQELERRQTAVDDFVGRPGFHKFYDGETYAVDPNKVNIPVAK